MKLLRYFLAAILLVTLSAGEVSAQNITNTLGTGGTFTIKDLSTTFFTLSAGKVGIGTTSPSYPFHVKSIADWVVVGEATASSGDVWGGVFFSPNSSTGRGVYGGGNAIGVYGTSPATSGTNYGVYGISYSPDGTGVRGYAQAGSGNSRGVSGESVSGTGVGVYGASNGSGTAVYAESKGGGLALQTTGGAILFGSTTGGTPASGPGVRLMWIPAKGAFRAGVAGTTSWDDANIGTYSTAMGDGTTASGYGSTAMGNTTTASGDHSTAMGRSTTASNSNSIAMGRSTTASGDHSTAMGWSTTASGQASVAMGEGAVAQANSAIAMGYGTTASANRSTAIGWSTLAGGFASTAMGYNVGTDKEGSFIIGDHSAGNYTTVNDPNSFMAVFAGGYVLYTNRNWQTGVRVNPGGVSWVWPSDSTRKENFKPVDGEYVLESIRQLRLESWNYKGQEPAKFRHYGPMAQEWNAAFGSDGLGVIGDDTTLTSADVDGILYIAVKALVKRTGELKEKDVELQAKTAELEVVKSELSDMKVRLARLEVLISPPKELTQRVSDENSSPR